MLSLFYHSCYKITESRRGQHDIHERSTYRTRMGCVHTAHVSLMRHALSEASEECSTNSSLVRCRTRESSKHPMHLATNVVGCVGAYRPRRRVAASFCCAPSCHAAPEMVKELESPHCGWRNRSAVVSLDPSFFPLGVCARPNTPTNRFSIPPPPG